MTKDDRDYVNKGQAHELNYQLKKFGYRETKENREILKNILPNNTKSADVEKHLNNSKDTSKLEKK